MTSRYDVIVIGSGISGLTCAALLAKKGKSVLVLEKHTKPGGYMHSFRRFGEIFDTGAHYVGALGPGQPFRVLLEYLEVFNEQDFVELNKKAFDVFCFPEGKISLPASYEALLSELGACFPNEKSAIRQFFEMVQKTVKNFPTYNFSEDVEMTASLEALQTPLSAIVESLTSNQKLQSLLYAYCGLHGVEPKETPFGLHAIVIDSLIRGPYGFRQGGDSLAAAFVKKIEASGCAVKLGQNVTALRVKNDLIQEVQTEKGESYQAEWVISSLHPKVTFRLLGEEARMTPAFRDRLNLLKETDGIFGVYARCQNLDLDPLQNYYYFASSDPKSLFTLGSPLDPPPVVFASMSRTRAFQKGERVLSLHSGAKYSWFSEWKDSKFGKRPAEYQELKQTISKNIFSMIDKFEPHFSEKVEKYVSSSPLSNIHFNGSEEGSAYGLYHSIQNTGARAIGPRTKVLNLLLTGQNYLFPGLLGASISGLRSTGHILGIKPILKDLRQAGEKS